MSCPEIHRVAAGTTGTILLLLLAGQLLTLPSAEAAVSAGDVFHLCRRSDPQLGECIRQSMQELLPSVVKGIPELKIPKHDPLFLPKISILQGQGPVSLDSTFTNQLIYGISNTKFLSASADLDKNEIKIDFAAPYLFFEGNYSMDGRILLVPMKGQGFGRTNYTGVTGHALFRGHRETRGGHEFLELDEIKFDLNVKNAKIHMDNLFNGEKVLGERLSRVLEENWELFFAELKPVVDESVGALLGSTARRVFTRFPVDELFPQ